jgi:ribonuclease-3
MIDDQTVEQAEAILGYSFRDPALLRTALTHASLADTRIVSNERLEFLGDAVLGFVVCEYLYENFPDLLEGDLTKIKSAVVSRQTCARVASDLGLHELLAIGKGMQTRSVLPPSLAAAVYESITGAMYLDTGIETARQFIIDTLEDAIITAAESGHQQNFKSVLQQHAQNAGLPQPGYVLLDEKGPDHAKAFQIAVTLDGDRYPACWAQSKKRAEQLAALAALEQLGLITRDDDGRALYMPDEAISEAE